MSHTKTDRAIFRREFEVQGLPGFSRLHIPFFVNASDLSDKQIDNLIERIEGVLGVQYFRSRDLFKEVLKERQAKAQDKYKWLSGPYIGVTAKHSLVLRLTSMDSPLEGATVYAYDHIEQLLGAVRTHEIEQPEATQAGDLHRNRPKN